MRRKKQYMEEVFSEANPMTDLLFICIFCFGLMFTVAKFNVIEPQEKALPDVQLSQIGDLPAGFRTNAELSITIRQEKDRTILYLNDKKIDRNDLSDALSDYAGCTRVAIRRDKQITTGFEDQVIAACAKSGIRSIALVVKQPGGSENEN